MDFLTFIAISLMTALSALIFLRRLAPWSKIIRYRAVIDVLFTVALFLIFAGTLGGALVAAMGGLFLSGMLGIARAIQRSSETLTPRRF